MKGLVFSQKGGFMSVVRKLSLSEDLKNFDELEYVFKGEKRTLKLVPNEPVQELPTPNRKNRTLDEIDAEVRKLREKKLTDRQIEKQMGLTRGRASAVK